MHILTHIDLRRLFSVFTSHTARFGTSCQVGVGCVRVHGRGGSRLSQQVLHI